MLDKLHHSCVLKVAVQGTNQIHTVTMYLCHCVFCIFTSHAGAVVKYCSEHVCVCVCLSVCPQAYLLNHTCDLYQIFCACCLSPRLGLPQGGLRNPRGRDNFGSFLPLDNALYSIAFGADTKMAVLIKIPFVMMIPVGPRYQREGAIFGGKPSG